jgi:sterol 3beta-glucosyltransferase
MRAVITNFGTTGDVMPFLALAVELRRHKHEVVLALPPHYKAWVESYDLEFFSTGAEFQQATYELNRYLMAELDMQVSFEQMTALYASQVEALPQLFHDLCDACYKADVIICGTLPPSGHAISAKLGIPFVSVQIYHFGGKRLPSGITPFINPLLTQLGFGSLHDGSRLDSCSPFLNLIAISRYVIPPPADLPDHHHITGYFFLDTKGTPDHELVEFIDGSSPLIVFSFGSMLHHDPKRVTDIFLESIRRIGCRAIIQHGSSNLAIGDLPSNIRAVGFVPHNWLFSRAACVVHHGGAGTTAATLRLGVPSVVVPHLFDQPIWAQLIHELGCSEPPIAYSQLTVERLTSAINTTITTSGYHRTTSSLSKKINTEMGVQKARQLIEDLVYKKKLYYQNEGMYDRQSIEITGKIEESTLKRKHYQYKMRARKRFIN